MTKKPDIPEYIVVQISSSEETAISEPREIRHGIFQGSSLGPLLFLIFINELPRVCLKSKIFCFADDILMVTGAEGKSNMQDILTTEINTLMNWLKNHKLVPNLKKTRVMYPRYRVPEGTSPELYYGNEKIPEVKEMVHLGIILDQQMTWKPQIAATLKMLRPINLIFFNLRKYLPTTALINIYRSWFESRIAYGLTLWGSANVTALRPIKTLQNFAVRLITKSERYSHSNEMYRAFNLLQAETIYKEKLQKLTNKHILPNQPKKEVKIATRSSETNTIALPSWKKTKSRNHPYYRAIVLHNSQFSTVHLQNSK